MTKFKPIKVTPAQGEKLAQTHAGLWRGLRDHQPEDTTERRYGGGVHAPNIMRHLKDR